VKTDPKSHTSDVAQRDSAASAPLYDLVTFGETMVRFTTPPGIRLESAPSLSLTIGGAESNVAVALARLGHRVAWLSALPDNPFGRRITRELAQHGVDVSRVVWVPEGRVGTYFLESGSAPRPARVLYDRADSAIALVNPDAIDTAIVRDARALHLTGITPALSSGCAAICARLADAATEVGVPVILDVNYRSRLWPPEAAAGGLAPLMQRANVLLCGMGDARTIWGLTGDAEDVARDLLARSSATLVVVTMAERGALSMTRDGVVCLQPAMPVVAVDAVGAGDAFAAGFLSRWLDAPADLPSALRSATAMAALKMTIAGDFALVTADELAEALAAIDASVIDIDR
jgi:2-dehydro-3-deoxygluconokinase